MVNRVRAQTRETALGGSFFPIFTSGSTSGSAIRSVRGTVQALVVSLPLCMNCGLAMNNLSTSDVSDLAGVGRVVGAQGPPPILIRYRAHVLPVLSP